MRCIIHIHILVYRNLSHLVTQANAYTTYAEYFIVHQDQEYNINMHVMIKIAYM